MHYDLPGGLAGEVRAIDGLTWAKFFAYLGLGLAGLGLTLATFGTGTVAVAGRWARRRHRDRVGPHCPGRRQHAGGRALGR